MNSVELDKYKEMEKILGEPFDMEYQEDVLKTRRNLLLVGGLCILVWQADLKINPSENFSIFGIPFQHGGSHLLLPWCLFFVTLYLTIHFFWNSWDAIQEYRLRRTGTRTHYQTTGKLSSKGMDGPIHPRQSTLYSWWLEQAGNFDDIPEQLQRQQESYSTVVAKLETLCRRDDDPNNQNFQNALQAVNQAKSESWNLQLKIEAMSKIFSSERIPVSLKRFDEAFHWRAISQNFRWLIIEFVVPLVIGIVGFCAMIAMICGSTSE